MVTTVFATKIGMMQAWTTQGKRLAVTRCKVTPNKVVAHLPSPQNPTQLEIGYGEKKLKNMSKPLRTRLERSGFTSGVQRLIGVKLATQGDETQVPAIGQEIAWQDIVRVGDIVQVQGTTKGRGFAGAIKRHGFHGGPKTHGQSDRARAVGSIGAGTTPGRVLKGKKMPGHYGVDTQSVKGLVVLRIDEVTQEVWLSGPVPGHLNGFVAISKTGKTKQVELDESILPAEFVRKMEVQETPEVSETPPPEAEPITATPSEEVSE